MTDLLTRPILRVKATEALTRRPMAVSAPIAGVAAALAGLLVSVAAAVGVWFAGDTGSFGDAVRVGAFAWLVANGTGVTVGAVSFTAIPLGFLALCALGVYWAGRWAGASSAVRHGGDVATGAALVAAGYAGTGIVVRAVAHTDNADVGLLRTVVALGLTGIVFGGLGVIRGSDSVEPVLARVPPPVRSTVVGALAGFLTMLSLAAVIFVGSMLVHFSQAVTLQEGLTSGTVGAIALTLIGMASVPNAVLCAGAFAAGPGFAVGTGSTVAPGDVSLGQLPGLPVLAALPSSGGDTWWYSVLILVPVLAGAVAGLVALRRDPVFGLDQAALRGALSGALGGVAFGATTWLATGAIGPGRMQEIGPHAAATTLVCGLAFLLGGAAAACVARWWQSVRAGASLLE